MWHTQSCNWKKGSTLSSIMMRCHCNQWANAGGLGWLKGNSHSERRGMDALFMSQTFILRPWGVFVSHRPQLGAQAQLPIGNRLKRWMPRTIIYPGKNADALVGYCTAAHADQRRHPDFLNTCTQELLASGCLIAHWHMKHLPMML